MFLVSFLLLSFDEILTTRDAEDRLVNRVKPREL